MPLFGGVRPACTTTSMGDKTMSLVVKTTRKLRNQICDLSTHDQDSYYDTVAHWHNKLERLLEESALTTREPCPSIHTDTGRGYVTIVADRFAGNTEASPVQGVAFSWYRMLSGRWEVTCNPAP